MELLFRFLYLNNIKGMLRSKDMRYFYRVCTIFFAIGIVVNASENAFTADQVVDYGVERLMNEAVVAPLEQYKGVVKVEVDMLVQDYAMPWQTRGYSSGIGTAFLVGKKKFMTNAHVVSNAERIYISQYGDSRKIPARVKYIAHDADLALLEIDDFTQFEKLPYLEFSKDLPQLEDEVRVIGYPVGGNRLSVTRGVVSRIDFIPYAHSGAQSHLAIQVDAAINPGNSGGPVLMGNKVIGVAFQGISNAKGTGYVIPYSVVNRFLKDIKDGRYDSYVDLGATLFPIINPAMRKALHLNNDEKGVLVGSVLKGASADGFLEVGDVIVKVDGYEVDSSGMIVLDGDKIKMEELVERRFAGDSLTMLVVRKGKEEKVSLKLKPLRTADLMAVEYEKKPRYVIFGGMLFQPLQYNVISALKIPNAAFLLEMDRFIEKGDEDKEEIILITSVLDDEINARMSGGGKLILEKVNGEKVKSLSHLYQILYQEGGDKGEYVVIETKGSSVPFVFERKMVNEANERIARKYLINSNAYLGGDN